MMDPTLGYGAPPAANFVDDYPEAHRMEHSFRQSAPDSYGIGMGMMGGLGGGMGINNMPGSQMMLYGRGGMGGYGTTAGSTMDLQGYPDFRGSIPSCYR
ncbi:hypothetical protein BCR39DRAFT_601511, partial [Naematelia encephala]